MVEKKVHDHEMFDLFYNVNMCNWIRFLMRHVLK